MKMYCDTYGEELYVGMIDAWAKKLSSNDKYWALLEILISNNEKVSDQQRWLRK